MIPTEKGNIKAMHIKHKDLLTDEEIMEIPFEKVYEWIRTGQWKQRDFKKWLKAWNVIKIVNPDFKMKIKGCRKSLVITYTQAQTDKLRNFGYVTGNGVVYDYDLTYSGAMFGLIREAHHTDADIEAAANELRRDRDVVGLINICSVQGEE